MWEGTQQVSATGIFVGDGPNEGSKESLTPSSILAIDGASYELSNKCLLVLLINSYLTGANKKDL